MFSLCLLLVLCTVPFQGRSIADLPPGTRNGSGEAVKKSRIAIGSIRIEEPRIILRMGKSRKSEGSVLDQLQSIARGSVAGASAEIVLKESRQKIGIRNGSISVGDFSRQSGGALNLRGEVRYEKSGKENIEIDGTASAALDFRALNPSPSCTGNLSLDIVRGSYGEVSFDRLSAKVPFALSGTEISLKAAELGLGDVRFKISGKPVAVTDVRLRGSVVYNYNVQTVVASSINGSIPPAGDFSGSLSAAFKGPLTFRASIDTPSMDIKKIDGTIRTYLPPAYQGWEAQGKASVHSDIEGSYSQKRPSFKVGQRIAVTGGGLSSSDGTRVAQGVQSRADLTASYDASLEKLDFTLSSTLSEGEFLWGTYYRDFAGKTTRADGKGSLGFTGEKAFSFDAYTDLFGAGSIKGSGSGRSGGQLFAVEAKDVSLDKLFTLFLDDYIKDNFPSMAGLKISGSSSISLSVKRTGEQNDLDGAITLNIPSMALPAKNMEVSGMRLELPFDLGYPKAVASSKRKRGILEVKSMEKDKIKTANIRIPMLLSGNRLWFPEDADINVADGDIAISGFSAEDILSPERRISCGLRIEKVSLRPVEGSFTTSPISGSISADYPKVVYYHDKLTAEGKTTVKVFGGEIEVGNIAVQKLSSPSRKIATNIFFRGINLESMTEKIAVGKMTGVIQGSLRDFEMEHGQPTHFVFDIDSVDTSGVSQRISVEAIQSISILGTGSGMSAVLNRGIMSFFKDYPYSRIGMRATLENDTFIVRGKIHSGGTEYLVKRGFLRGVDVVNQNPDNKISFKDMHERLQRIFEERKAGSAPVVQ